MRCFCGAVSPSSGSTQDSGLSAAVQRDARPCPSHPRAAETFPLPGAVRAGPHSGRLPASQGISGRSLQDLTGAGERAWLEIRLDHRPPGILVQVPGSDVCMRVCMDPVEVA